MTIQRMRTGRTGLRQRGGTLIVVVALILGACLVSLTGLFLARGQGQLVGNIQHQEGAFNEAEASAVVAELWLATGSNARSAVFSTYDASAAGLYPTGKLRELGLDPATMTWGTSNSVSAGAGRYLVERIARAVKVPGASLQVGQRATGSCNQVDIFRVVAQSSSTRGATRMIETMAASNGCY